MLVGSFRGFKILVTTPLLRWYLAHGLVVGRVNQIIVYEPNPCFRRFGKSVSAGYDDPDKATIADMMNSSAIQVMGRRSPTLIDIAMSSTAPKSAHQQQTVSTTGCRHRRRVRNADEQECHEVHTATSYRLLRLPVRQTTHATVIL